MINYLYCFDYNYNIQALCSMYSLLEQSSEKLNIDIIHNDPSTFKKIYSIVLKHPFLNELKIHEFKNSGIDFPNVTGTHISEATYYRLFIENYLSSKNKYYVYMDADIICHKDPTQSVNASLFDLESTKYTISVKTEHRKTKNSEEMFKRLSLAGSTYFNAGVMLINYKKWKKDNLTSKLTTKMNILGDTIVFWDQDVLNSYFDGEYLELNNNLNYNLHLTEENSKKKIVKQALNEMILIHYSGSFKPWTVRGAYNVNSIYYHRIFFQIFKKRYHIISKWRIGSLIQLIKGFLNLNIFFISKPFSFIKYSLMSILIKDEQ